MYTTHPVADDRSAHRSSYIIKHWSIPAKTRQTPWSRFSPLAQVPDASVCSVSVYNGTADLMLTLPVVVPKQWTAMDLQQMVMDRKVANLQSQKGSGAQVKREWLRS